MTIDLARYFSNSLSKQFKIAHLPINVLVFKTEDIPENISSKILQQYGETYLEDAQYVIFFKGGIDKEVREKLFKQVDRALGGNKDKKKNANLLTVGDLRLLKMSDDEESFGDEEQEDSGIQDQVNDIVNEPEEDLENSEESSELEDNGTAIDNALDNDEEAAESAEPADEETDEDLDDDSEDSDGEEADDVTDESISVGKDLLGRPVLEDDEAEEDAESAEAKPALPTKYVFLKITLKK